MDQWLGLAYSCGNNESTKKTVDKSKRKKGNMMTHFCNMDLLVVVKTEWKNLFA